MLTLYEHPFALYCQKVLVALNELGVAYDVLEEQRDFDRAQLAQLWPPASIPVLRDGDEVIGETSIIIEHVAGPRLVPSLEARKWDRLCDQYISDAVQAIVFETIDERALNFPAPGKELNPWEMTENQNIASASSRGGVGA